MAVFVLGTVKPKNGKSPVAEAQDILMPDGSRLSDFDSVAPVVPGTAVLEPETYYVFGTVEELAVTLEQKDDGKAHEFTFEFIPSADFRGMVITPEPVWLREPQYPAGRRCIVSIVRGLAVMGSG